jgi:hypothetical protein
VCACVSVRVLRDRDLCMIGSHIKNKLTFLSRKGVRHSGRHLRANNVAGNVPCKKQNQGFRTLGPPRVSMLPAVISKNESIDMSKSRF